VGEWRAKWASDDRPILVHRRLPGRAEIIDRRTDEEHRTTLKGWQAAAYEACDESVHSAKRVHQDLLDAGWDLALGDVTSFLDECCDRGLMVSEDGKYLALALPGNAHW
jgi:hypothetical protein